MSQNKQSLRWDYFLLVEADFIETHKYVHPSIYNSKTYSLKYWQILQCICSEIDSTLKDICREISPDMGASISGRNWKISDSYDLIRNKDKTTTRKCRTEWDKKFQDIWSLQIFPSNETWNNIQPWQAWSSQNYDKEMSIPIWWNSYNLIKHNRNDATIKEATLENVIYAFCALIALLIDLDFSTIKKGPIFVPSNFFVVPGFPHNLVGGGSF